MAVAALRRCTAAPMMAAHTAWHERRRSSVAAGMRFFPSAVPLLLQTGS